MLLDSTTCLFLGGLWPVALLRFAALFLAAESLGILPKSLGPFCLLLFKMVAQNVLKFDQFQHEAATCCQFMTLFTEKMNYLFKKSEEFTGIGTGFF